MRNVHAILTADGSFQTLLTLLQAAGLTDLLKQQGPLTLFAPDDDAFQRIKVDEVSKDPETLTSLLSYHIVEGKYTADEIAGKEHLLTSSGKSLTVHLEAGSPLIDNARYVKADIECGNGVVHVIDNVFLPRMSGWYCGSCC